jgi:hypothetical protein
MLRIDDLPPPRAYHVDEGVLSKDQRIMSWRSPSGKLTIALTNRTTAPYTFDIGLLTPGGQFAGHRFDATRADVSLGSKSATALRSDGTGLFN